MDNNNRKGWREFSRRAAQLSQTERGVLRHALCMARNEVSHELASGERLVSMAKGCHLELNAEEQADLEVLNSLMLAHVQPRLPALRLTLQWLDDVEGQLFGAVTPARTDGKAVVFHLSDAQG